jgi:hypothetical protein
MKPESDGEHEMVRLQLRNSAGRKWKSEGLDVSEGTVERVNSMERTKKKERNAAAERSRGMVGKGTQQWE